MSEKKPTCRECGHPMNYLRSQTNAPFGEGFVWDFAEFWCPYCSDKRQIGFPPVPIDKKL